MRGPHDLPAHRELHELLRVAIRAVEDAEGPSPVVVAGAREHREAVSGSAGQAALAMAIRCNRLGPLPAAPGRIEEPGAQAVLIGQAILQRPVKGDVRQEVTPIEGWAGPLAAAARAGRKTRPAGELLEFRAQAAPAPADGRALPVLQGLQMLRLHRDLDQEAPGEAVRPGVKPHLYCAGRRLARVGGDGVTLRILQGHASARAKVHALGGEEAHGRRLAEKARGGALCAERPQAEIRVAVIRGEGQSMRCVWPTRRQCDGVEPEPNLPEGMALGEAGGRGREEGGSRCRGAGGGAEGESGRERGQGAGGRGGEGEDARGAGRGGEGEGGGAGAQGDRQGGEGAEGRGRRGGGGEGGAGGRGGRRRGGSEGAEARGAPCDPGADAGPDACADTRTHAAADAALLPRRF
mmetsp:Transcript_121694/g.349795  ORF Transcript_121694/g.349795 Transcript_121694/m.349795 type:complete len:408 (+) Transcript_121694:585-1808(+)